MTGPFVRCGVSIRRSVAGIAGVPRTRLLVAAIGAYSLAFVALLAASTLSADDTTARAIVAMMLGLVALLPLVQWLGQVNSALPLPDWVRALEEAQMQLIEQVLAGGTGVFFNLLVLAVTPAFCEELLFRGYVQRQAERALGVATAILFSGFFFGLYHLRLTQLLPLVLLGVYLAYITWRTGSLWPAVVVHFANNAFAVALGAVASARPGWSLDEIEAVTVPGYVVAVSLVAVVAIVFLLDRTARNVLNSGVTDSLRL